MIAAGEYPGGRHKFPAFSAEFVASRDRAGFGPGCAVYQSVTTLKENRKHYGLGYFDGFMEFKANFFRD